MRYAFIKEHRGHWAVSLMAEVLAVSVSGFYDWLGRPKSKRTKEDETLTQKIVMFHCGSRCTYGSLELSRFGGSPASTVVDPSLFNPRLHRQRV